jgi:hypothetical protein
MLADLDLSGRPVLVIDDEADQASLNAKVNSGEQTTTYTRIMELRSEIPHHTFLQYTATPQAPLLINIIDLLSPNFVEVLEQPDRLTVFLTVFSEVHIEGNQKTVR